LIKLVMVGCLQKKTTPGSFAVVKDK